MISFFANLYHPWRKELEEKVGEVEESLNSFMKDGKLLLLEVLVQ